MYKHVEGTLRSGAKRGMKRVSSDAKKGKKITKYDIFHMLLRSLFLKSLAVSHQLQINNNNIR